jgi:hypothetical protein
MTCLAVLERTSLSSSTTSTRLGDELMECGGLTTECLVAENDGENGVQRMLLPPDSPFKSTSHARPGVVATP